VAGIIAVGATAERQLVYEGALRATENVENVCTSTLCLLGQRVRLDVDDKGLTRTKGPDMQLIETGRLSLWTDEREIPARTGLPADPRGLFRRGFRTRRLRAGKGAPPLKGAPSADEYLARILPTRSERGSDPPLLRRCRMPDIATCKNAALTAPARVRPGERWEYGLPGAWDLACKLVRGRCPAVARESLPREHLRAPVGHEGFQGF